ncbi:ParB/Srx family N-terminal domain-containing protein [Pigmentiphaga litoralis]|uniref:Chromosome partitioning protein ParB n=1 Tax=Pigmentiphaga litoralis TaxID=516702 RepID=A0A7Y9IS72_9BURK|nr:ParB/Srx family N-terminal domain-containing protein [Pigmentiphaga litoralis]NYE24295.1 hypothetical protein [Pigmentiphaga litoralis]NYE82091.1 hypothetical protein [Pigmentiphaga litoralis]
MMFPFLRRPAAARAAAALATSLALTGPALASAADVASLPRAIADLAPGAVLHLRIDDLRPTQPAVGYDQIYATLERYRRSPQDKFDDYCFVNGQRGVKAFDAGTSRIDDPASFACKQDAPDAASPHAATLYGVVIGPGGTFYLQSGHHTAVTLTSLPDGGSHVRMTVRVVENYSQMLPGVGFWTRMAAERRVWLRNAQGQMIAPEALPQTFRLVDLRDDPYRSLVFFTRGIGYVRPQGGTPHVEMAWAYWLRKRRDPDLSAYRLDDVTSYRDAVIAAARKMVALRDNDILVDRMTALSLGKLPSFDAKDGLRKVAREGTATQPPGPLLDAVMYKQRFVEP